MSEAAVPIPDDAVISADTRRENRIPPRQVLTRKWPVLHYGPTPIYDLSKWEFSILKPFVEQPKSWTWAEFAALPRIKVYADMHCVTRWSKLDNLWEGVSTRTIMEQVKIRPEAKFVMIHCEYGFSTNLPLEDFLGEDCLFALKHNDQDLEPDHGYPVRLVIPRLYAWKSAKWVRAIELMDRDRPGFWEEWQHGGYHMRGDPWAEQRFRDD